MLNLCETELKEANAKGDKADGILGHEWAVHGNLVDIRATETMILGVAVKEHAPLE